MYPEANTLPKQPYPAVPHGTSSAAGLVDCWISIPEGFDCGDRVYLIQTKSGHKHYAPVIAKTAKSGSRAPGREKAPLPKFLPKNSVFPEGMYAAVSRIEDMYVLQSSRPVQVMLSLNRKTASYLLADNKPPLPFKPSEIILVLEPYFPQSVAETLPDKIERLVERGYRKFVCNNPGHFSLFRAFKDMNLIAGPWLYTFNSWAVSFVASWGVDGFVSPYENNRQNLERTLGENSKMRAMFFVPVFAWPPLFQIHSDLGKIYDLKIFSDNMGECFSLITDPDCSTVIPQTPFSITDKIPFLKEAGFKRFVIDLSGPVLKKGDYRDLMRMVSGGTPLHGISRFNWKDGFFQNSGRKRPVDHG
jgi:putative protease